MRVDESLTARPSPEEVLARHFMERAQANAPPGDARRRLTLREDRVAAHAAVQALRDAGWRIVSASPFKPEPVKDSPP